jgi:hypothetical protein
MGLRLRRLCDFVHTVALANAHLLDATAAAGRPEMERAKGFDASRCRAPSTFLIFPIFLSAFLSLCALAR